LWPAEDRKTEKRESERATEIGNAHSLAKQTHVFYRPGKMAGDSPESSSDSSASTDDRDNSSVASSSMRRPKDTALKQQRMKSWQPILDPWYVIATLAAIGIVFAPVGVVLNRMSNEVVMVKRLYDKHDDPDAECGINDTANAGRRCSVTLTVPQDMTPPIFLHYEITNFYQNHKRYEASRSDFQLLGSIAPLSEREAHDCRPLYIVGNITIHPSGLIANTLFNDVITLESATTSDGTDVPLVMREDGIAWHSDLEYKFRQPNGFRYERCDSCETCSCDGTEWSCREPYVASSEGNGTVCYRYFYPNDDTTQYLHETYPMVVSPLEGVMNEHFVVWMRVAALPRFRKLYGWIQQPIAAGTNITFDILANWEVQSFKGSKALILSNSNQFGGRNEYFGNSFFYIGICCLILAALFGAKQKFRPRLLADRAYLQYKED